MLCHITVSKLDKCMYGIFKLYFVLGLNRNDVKDTEIESMMNLIVDGLFSVFVTLGTVFDDN